MRSEEARHVGQVLRRLVDEGAQVILNLGSSTAHFRCVEQPHIEREVFAPLRGTRARVIHADLKEAEGVDVAGDVFDPAVQDRLAALKPDVVLACNLMEHLVPPAREALPGILDRIVAPGGSILITVPFSYPLHFDPIDTYYRPSPEDLRGLLPRYDATDARVIESSTYLPELRALPLRGKLRVALRALAPFYRPRKWLGLAHRFLWLFRPYRVSCVVLKKPARA